MDKKRDNDSEGIGPGCFNQVAIWPEAPAKNRA